MEPLPSVIDWIAKLRPLRLDSKGGTTSISDRLDSKGVTTSISDRLDS